MSILVWPLTLDLTSMVEPGTKASDGIAPENLKARKLPHQRQGIDTTVAMVMALCAQGHEED